MKTTEEFKDTNGITAREFVARWLEKDRSFNRLFGSEGNWLFGSHYACMTKADSLESVAFHLGWRATEGPHSGKW